MWRELADFKGPVIYIVYIVITRDFIRVLCGGEQNKYQEEKGIKKYADSFRCIQPERETHG
jgi:hypothetical protein